MLEQFSKKFLDGLKSLRLNLEQLWLLERFYKNKGNEDLDPVIFQGLERKELVKSGKITEEGKIIYEVMLESCEPVEVTVVKEFVVVEKIVEKKGEAVVLSPVNEEDFQRLWQAYPKRDTFKWKDKFFPGARTLRKDEAKCREAFKKVMHEKRYTIEEILKALEYEVWTRMSNSHLGKDGNQMKYMNMLSVWLNQKGFEAYLGMEIPEEKDEKPQSIDPQELF